NEDRKLQVANPVSEFSMSQVPPHNPYQSPSAIPKPVGAVELPVAAKVLGIIGIVLGVLGFIGMMCGLAAMMMPSSPAMPNHTADMMRESSVYRNFTIGSTALGFVALVVLLGGSIGLLQGKMWGRTLLIGYAAYALLSVLVGTAFNILVMYPLMTEMLAKQGVQADMSGFFYISTAVGAVIGSLFPTVLLFYMLNGDFVGRFRRFSESPH
ncbi:MAG: hypothetical protein KDA84_09110, partial [Planctomycetaceae bacterium]|nr:hypothetical protein [Planctomycetaceae bacterium]